MDYNTYIDADEKNVRCRKLYCKADDLTGGSDVMLYMDAAFTKKAPAADLKRMFEFGIVIVTDDGEVRPVEYTTATNSVKTYDGTSFIGE